MRVLFLTRRNAFDAPGGDSIQLLKTREGLERMGVIVEIHDDARQDISKFDIIHVFNITGLPETSLFHILKAKSYRKPVVLSPIFWSEGELNTRGFRIAGFEFLHNKDFVDFVRCVSISALSWLHLSRLVDAFILIRSNLQNRTIPEYSLRIKLGKKRIQTECLKHSDAILPNSFAEAALLQKEFEIDPQKIHVIPNAVDKNSPSVSPMLFENQYGISDFVLSVSNIAIRKNNLMLIEAAAQAGLPLVMIGVGQPNDPYYGLCLTRARATGALYLGGLQHDSQMLASAYRAAKVHALVSWYETPGLATLEAAASGCNIVSTTRGSAREYLHALAWYCDPGDINSVMRALVSAYRAPRNSELWEVLKTEYTWEQAAARTYSAYTKVLGHRDNYEETQH